MGRSGTIMKIVFFGTPYYVLPILESLSKNFRDASNESPIAAVITQPGKPSGRKQQIEYSPVDDWAHKKGFPKFFDPNDLIKENIQADVAVLASYGEMIPKNVINHFKFGILVIHPSLLPAFRWASPVPAALITGLRETGVSIIKMDEKWDHGPILTQMKEEILPGDTYGSLRDRLFEKSADLLIQMLPAYIKGKIKPKPQDDSKATFARIIKKEDAFIEPKVLWSVISGQWTEKEIQMTIGFLKVDDKAYTIRCTPFTVHNFIRAMDPWPFSWTYIQLNSKSQVPNSKKLKILKAHTENEKLILDLVQLEGKNPVTWEQFKAGYPNYKFI